MQYSIETTSDSQTEQTTKRIVPTMLGLQTRNLEQQERVFKNQIRVSKNVAYFKHLTSYRLILPTDRRATTHSLADADARDPSKGARFLQPSFSEHQQHDGCARGVRFRRSYDGPLYSGRHHPRRHSGAYNRRPCIPSYLAYDSVAQDLTSPWYN